MKTIQSPDGVALLMENIWLRHKAGMKQRTNNVFIVELPPPTEGELREARRLDVPDYDQEELFGGFV